MFGIPLVPIRGFQRGLEFKKSRIKFFIANQDHKVNDKGSILFNEFKPDVIIGTGGYAAAILFLLHLKKKRK